MRPSDLMAAQLSEIKQTLSLNLFKSSQATATAQAITMLEDFQQVQQVVEKQTIKPAPHPYAGQNVDIRG